MSLRLIFLLCVLSLGERFAAQTTGLDTTLRYRGQRFYAKEIHGDFVRVDSLMRQLPKKAGKNVESLVAYINGISANDYEKVRAIYTYVGENMAYDEAKADNIKNVKRRLSANELMKSNKGICGDISEFFHELCKQLNIPSQFVVGYTKQFRNPPHRKHLDHAWNLVKLEDNWYLIDATWGMKNNTDKRKNREKISYFYFLSSPHFFVRSHLPADPMFQLLENPISFEEFKYGRMNIRSRYYRASIPFADTLNRRLKMSENSVQLQIAKNAFAFNPRYKMVAAHLLWDHAEGLLDLERLDKNKLALEDLKRAKEVYELVQDQGRHLAERRERRLVRYMQKKIDKLNEQIVKLEKRKGKQSTLVVKNQ